MLDLFAFIEYITFPFTQHGFVHEERKKLKSKMRESNLIATKNNILFAARSERDIDD